MIKSLVRKTFVWGFANTNLLLFFFGGLVVGLLIGSVGYH